MGVARSETDKLPGRVLKGVGSFYTVDAGAHGLWECRLRGRFRREKQEVLPGDIVAFGVVDESGRKGIVEEVAPRSNRLLRPPVANVDLALIVLAADQPQPDMWLLDRLLIMIQAESIQPLLCWNKMDLAGQAVLEGYRKPYDAAGVEQLATCAVSGAGVKELGERLAGRMTVLAGPSGVGKSSLLNRIEPGIELKTGEISDKLGRGRHTTRHVEWIPLAIGGWVADTPGFSQLLMPEGVTSAGLAEYYPEFEPLAANCRFRSCIHDQDRDCGVSQGAREGAVDEGRYRRYRALLKELKEREATY
ncbi:MAG: ribosome small subunit-dependent GTPase A [Clostridiales bacterium]|nr:ribosome small subunit-dependent GTPase A [Clostridiales bacterium]